jgi:hypothetical protein
MSWKPYTDDMKQDSEDVLSNTAMLTVEPFAEYFAHHTYRGTGKGTEHGLMDREPEKPFEFPLRATASSIPTYCAGRVITGTMIVESYFPPK